MIRRNLQDWAAIAEILGTVAVVISLVFVAYSVNRNTVELRLANEDALWQLNDEIISGLLNNSDILSIVDKRTSGEDLTRVEQWSLYAFTTRQFNAWEMAIGNEAGEPGFAAHGGRIGDRPKSFVIA